MSATPAGIAGEITLVSALTAQPGKGDELIALLKGSKAGTLSYDLLRFEDQISALEKFADAAAVQTHLQSAEFKDIKEKQAELVVAGSFTYKFYGSA